MPEKKKNTYKLNYEELSGLCFQIALMLHSGVLIYDGFESMCNVRDQSSAVHRILRDMAEEVKENARLCDAMDKTGAFPAHMISMVELGENTGKLEDVMTALSENYKREERLRSMIFGAVFYPVILFVMILIVIVVLVTRILPEFSRVLESMGVELSPFVHGLLYVGSDGSKYILIAVIVVFAAIGGIIIYSKINKKDRMLRDILFKIPFLQRTAEKIAAGQFASAMVLALSSGYNIEDAFGLMRNIITSRRALNKVNTISMRMQEGDTFTQAVIITGLFDGMPERMVAVGERTGKLDEAMSQISSLYEDETTLTLNNLVSMIEPVMVAFLTIIIGIIMMAIMLPLLGIISSIG